MRRLTDWRQPQCHVWADSFDLCSEKRGKEMKSRQYSVCCLAALCVEVRYLTLTNRPYTIHRRQRNPAIVKGETGRASSRNWSNFHMPGLAFSWVLSPSSLCLSINIANKARMRTTMYLEMRRESYAEQVSSERWSIPILSQRRR